MENELFRSVFPLVLTIGLAMLIPVIMMGLSRLLGPRSRDPVKLSPYECGIQNQIQKGDARHRFNVKFYLVAMFFLVFDVEILFMYPWAASFTDNSVYSLVAMISFAAVLFFGWLYLVKRGAFDWD
ncbi:MAG: NADH-quinone oxidoreductase subunit A [Leptospiraceae bacterium]|nr:NADH-quinone oxidoreductase subunit A [Leptospiraceae bacterium]